MIEIPSTIEGKRYLLQDLEETLKPMGYSIGGNWDYDHGSFDYKISNDDGYLFLRLPFTAVEGQLDVDGCVVRIEQPFLLSHVYEKELSKGAFSGPLSASFNQFQEPVDKDGEFPEEYIDVGKSLLSEVEAALK